MHVCKCTFYTSINYLSNKLFCMFVCHSHPLITLHFVKVDIYFSKQTSQTINKLKSNGNNPTRTKIQTQVHLHYELTFSVCTVKTVSPPYTDVVCLSWLHQPQPAVSHPTASRLSDANIRMGKTERQPCRSEYCGR